MSQPLSIRIDKKLDLRLTRIAKLTGRTKSFYLRQALAEQIEDLEDFYVAKKVSARLASGKEGTVALEVLEGELAVED